MECYFVPEIYLFVRSYPLPFKRQKLFGGTRKFQKMTWEEYEKNKKDFEKEKKKVFNSLILCGLSPEVLRKEEMVWGSI